MHKGRIVSAWYEQDIHIESAWGDEQDHKSSGEKGTHLEGAQAGSEVLGMSRIFTLKMLECGGGTKNAWDKQVIDLKGAS